MRVAQVTIGLMVYRLKPLHLLVSVVEILISEAFQSLYCGLFVMFIKNGTCVHGCEWVCSHICRCTVSGSITTDQQYDIRVFDVIEQNETELVQRARYLYLLSLNKGADRFTVVCENHHSTGLRSYGDHSIRTPVICH